MRQYRVWLKQDKRMYSVSRIDFVDQTISYYHDCSLYEVHIDDVELMQATGLLDKDGRSIFEGDIVNEPGIYGLKKYVVKLEHFGASDDMGIDSFGYYDFNFAEILGNIYENKELLK